MISSSVVRNTLLDSTTFSLTGSSKTCVKAKRERWREDGIEGGGGRRRGGRGWKGGRRVRKTRKGKKEVSECGRVHTNSFAASFRRVSVKMHTCIHAFMLHAQM